MVSMLLLALCAAPFAIAYAHVTLKECMHGFQALDVQLGKYSRYSEFFRDTSVLSFAEAGDFEGYGGIQQYVHFAGANNPYVESALPVEQKMYTVAFDERRETCTFLILSISAYTMNRSNAVPAKMHRATATKITYDAEQNYVPKIAMYYTKPFLRAFFGGLLGTRKTRRYVCEALVRNCTTSYLLSGSPTQAECETKLAELPALSRESYIDGNDAACRALHAPSAALSPKYCPHISLVPAVDHKGSMKCQTSAQTPVSSLFSSTDLDLYANFTASHGIDPDVGYHLVCEDDTLWTRDGSSTGDCSWIAENPNHRCFITGAKFACAETCNPQCAGTNYYPSPTPDPATSLSPSPSSSPAPFNSLSAAMDIPNNSNGRTRQVEYTPIFTPAAQVTLVESSQHGMIGRAERRMG